MRPGLLQPLQLALPLLLLDRDDEIAHGRNQDFTACPAHHPDIGTRHLHDFGDAAQFAPGGIDDGGIDQVVDVIRALGQGSELVAGDGDIALDKFVACRLRRIDAREF